MLFLVIVAVAAAAIVVVVVIVVLLLLLLLLLDKAFEPCGGIAVAMVFTANDDASFVSVFC